MPTPAGAVSSTVELIQSAVLPREDLADLAMRFRRAPAEQARPSCETVGPGYEVGATRVFTLSDQDSNTQFQITATLGYRTPNVYMWVEQSPNRVVLDRNALRRAADEFDSRILPATREFFGNEARPGVDCDPRLHILHATGIGSTVGGYFSAPDGFPQAVRPDSNEAELFVINAEPGYNGANPGSSNYMSTLAHELQHMISFNQSHSPELWLEEGASQLAERINGYADEVATVYSFANRPETQLNTWSESSAGENSAHYGGAYLFWAYLYDRFGEDVVRRLARSPERSVPAFMSILAEQGIVNPDTGRPYTFEDLFADFAVANYLGRQRLAGDEEGRYRYTDTYVPPMSLAAELDGDSYPYEREDQVDQYGTHYVDLRGESPVKVHFTGSTSVPLLPMAESDGAFWWSNRADASNARLTREFDLTDVTSATLRFRAWHRLEQGYDYAYLSVSEDGGQTWTILPTRTCTTDDPNGSNLGCGFNGSSGATGAPAWIEESADLSPFAGNRILLRFETVTDAGVNREGLAVDAIEIPEIGFVDGADSQNGWVAQGFVRLDPGATDSPLLPQGWRVQAILFDDDGEAVLERLPLADDNTGSLRIDLGSDSPYKRAVLVISPVTPITTEPGTYRLAVESDRDGSVSSRQEARSPAWTGLLRGDR